MATFLTRLALVAGAAGLLASPGALAQSSANAVPLAQGSNGSELTVRDLPESLQPNRPLPVSADNLVMLTQVGSSNTAAIVQAGDFNQAQVAVFGNENSTALTQRGNRNAATVSVDGNRNPVNVSQRGEGNQYELDLSGDNNPVTLSQNGSGNRVRSELSGNNRQYSVSQTGQNNELTQRESAASVLPRGYSVEMRGSGIRVNIEQGRVTP